MSPDPNGHSILVRSTVFRPVTVLMLFSVILVIGLLSYPHVPVQMLPNGISLGQVGLFIQAPNGTPQENMEQIAKPCEDFLRTLPGLRNIVSSSGARRVQIRLEFDPNYEIGLLVSEIRDRMERAKPSWPEGVDRYFLWRHNDSEMPSYIASLGLKIAPGHRDRFEEGNIYDHLYEEIVIKRLEAVQGVARVRVWGLVEQRIEIAVDRDQMRGLGVDLSSLIQRLSKDNRSFNAGLIRDGDRELSIRVEGLFDDFEEVLAFPVTGDLVLGDFAKVRRHRTLRDSISRVNGQLARAVVVYAESGANAVDVCRRIQHEIESIGDDLKRTVPGIEGVETQNWLNQGDVISASIGGLRENALFGGFFAVVVLFLFFRRVGMTLLVTLAIPFSILITVIWIHFRGGSFNLLSMMGLSLGIGMLVDNSIVIVENILRKLEDGLSPRDAAVSAIREVGLAVSLATLTTVMVFLPLIFVSDPRFRVITAEIGLPLCVSVFASLLVALVFIPQGAIGMHRLGACFPFLGQRRDPSRTDRDSWLNRATVATVHWGLRHRLFAFVGVCALLSTTQWAFQLVPKAAMNMEGPSRLHMRVELPRNSTLREADESFSKIEKAIREAGEPFGIKSINSWFSVGGGEINIFPEPGRRVEEEEFFAVVRPKLPELPGVTCRLGFEDFGSETGRQRLMIYLEGNHFDRLVEAADRVEATMLDRKRFPYLREVHRWREDEFAEVQVSIDRRAASQRGIDTASVSRMVTWALRGSQLPDFIQPEREFPLWIRYSDSDKDSVEKLNEILVSGAGGSLVSLGNLASLQMVPGSGDINRRRGKMTIGLSARAEGKSVHEARQLLRYHLNRLHLPEGCEVRMSSPDGGFEADMRNARIALGMALCLVFFVMGLLFESWILPLSVLLSIPFAFFGSLWLLVATQTSLDAIGMIGMLMLVGIVVNNAIVLVDSINRKRDQGLERRHAILEAIRVRFRPIWMTALTTIFGLLPLILFRQQGDGVDYKSLAIVLVGGLATSTFFTLYVVPLLYSVLDDTRRLLRTMFRGL